jgi:2,3-bisphosphoglycerate-independent phosphoglycerate mutase
MSVWGGSSKRHSRWAERFLVTADHGNADIMKDEQGRPHTAHTHSPGPLIYIGPRAIQLSEGGALCDIAPTLLEHYGTQSSQKR